jgi:endonuclease G
MPFTKHKPGTDYVNDPMRQGYLSGLLGEGKLRIPLPEMTAPLKKLALPLAGTALGSTAYELKYINHSVVMHASRGLAIFSAASLSGSPRYKDLMRKNYCNDPWTPDPRIPEDKQIPQEYYAGNNFDLGHLSRCEDLEYGPSREDAIRSAVDTFHLTNSTPQHSNLNRSNLAGIWGRIEEHILEKSVIADHFAAQVFNGPVLEENDPILAGSDEKFAHIRYPLQYWKVLVAIDSGGKLYATAFLLSQAAVISQHGLRSPARGPGPFHFEGISDIKLIQVPVSRIEQLTRLRFHAATRRPLSRFDPLSTAAAALPGRRGAADAPGSRIIQSLDDILLPH